MIENTSNGTGTGDWTSGKDCGPRPELFSVFSFTWSLEQFGLSNNHEILSDLWGHFSFKFSDSQKRDKVRGPENGKAKRQGKRKSLRSGGSWRKAGSGEGKEVNPGVWECQASRDPEPSYLTIEEMPRKMTPCSGPGLAHSPGRHAGLCVCLSEMLSSTIAFSAWLPSIASLRYLSSF